MVDSRREITSKNFRCGLLVVIFYVFDSVHLSRLTYDRYFLKSIIECI